MDDATLSAYDRDAEVFADDWKAQPPPIDLHAVIGQYFIPGPTADIGCGSDHDAAWLNARGYPTIGFVASEGLLAEARRRHPQNSAGKLSGLLSPMVPSADGCDSPTLHSGLGFSSRLGGCRE
jgi:hypothetical protein